MHDGRTCVECLARLGRHLLGGHGYGVLLGVGQHAGEGAGEDGFVVAHGVVSALVSSSSASTLPAATLSLRPACRAVTVPSARAFSHISIFMASTHSSGCPALTGSPTATAMAQTVPATGERSLRGSRAWSGCGKGDFSSHTNTVAPRASVTWPPCTWQMAWRCTPSIW